MLEKPIDIYIHVKILLPYYNYHRRHFELFLEGTIPFQNGKPSLQQLEEMFDRYPPTTTQLVQALDAFGISPNHIAQKLGITKQAVSYHRSRPAKEYRNPELKEYLDPPKPKSTFDCFYGTRRRKKRKDSKEMIALRARQAELNQHRNPDQHPGVIVTSTTIVNNTQK